MVETMSYAEKIQAAAIIFPVIAALFTFIYIIREYHKYGALHFFKAVIIYSFIFYMLCAYFLIIMPLPTRSEAAAMTTPYIQLKLFYFMTPGYDKTETFYNCLLLIPLGFYLHYYFRKSFFSALCIIFATTLFFELTQLSGLYGIYPRPYRVFDVNDLMTNTAGGIIGWCAAPLFSFLPSRSRMDEVASEHGKTVSAARRFLGFALDLAVISVFYIIMKRLHLNLKSPQFAAALGVRLSDVLSNYMFLFCIYFIALPFISNGRTIGKILVNIRVVKCGTHPGNRTACLLRNLIHFGSVFLMPYLTWYFVGDSFACNVIAGICGILFIISVMLIIHESIHGKPKFYERLSGTTEISGTAADDE